MAKSKQQVILTLAVRVQIPTSTNLAAAKDALTAAVQLSCNNMHVLGVTVLKKEVNYHA